MHSIYKQFVYTLLFLTSFTQVCPQSIQDLQKLKTEYEKFQKSQGQLKLPTEIEQQIDPTTGLPKRANIFPYQYQFGFKDSIDKQLKHFGHDFFVRRDTVAFWENLPTPANYLLGPGDELIISLWGETQLRQSFSISREGNIYDEKVGILNLMGKNISEAEQYLITQFGRVYSTLKGRPSTTFMDVSLGNLRSINVNFVGEVKFPGVYPVHPFSNVITALIQAGGVDTTGSIRNIKIRRNNENYATVDLYNYLLKGDVPNNIQLRDQDIVVIPVRTSTITIDSAVVRPGIYESISGETIGQMISYAGGLKPHASSSIGLKRIIPIEERSALSSNIQNYYLNYSIIQLTHAQNGDVITALGMFKTISQVEIIGQIKKPGFYHYYSGMTIKDLIKLGGGFNDTTYFKSVYSIRGELVRRDPESRYEKIITVDLKNVMNGDSSNNVNLENLDRFVVHANLNFFERKNVQILGEVNIPGSYPLINDDESLQSLLNRAGGFSSKALEGGVSIYREKTYFEDPPEDKILAKLQDQDQYQPQTSMGQTKISLIDEKDDNKKVKLAWEGLGVILMPGDSIVVKERVGAVFVTGEVYNAGLVEFQSGKSIRYYLDSVGGINNYGNRNNVIVVYPNGITVPWRRFRSPKILDGSTIVVYQKADITPFDATEFASNTTSLLSSIVTIMVLSRQLNQQ